MKCRINFIIDLNSLDRLIDIFRGSNGFDPIIIIDKETAKQMQTIDFSNRQDFDYWNGYEAAYIGNRIFVDPEIEPGTIELR